MLGLMQSVGNTTTKVWSPMELLGEGDGNDYWWTSSYRALDSSGIALVHGGELVKWFPIVNAGNTTQLIFLEESTSGNEILYDRGYLYSEDGENSAITLKQSDHSTDQDQTLTGNFYMCWRVRFGSLDAGKNHLCQDKDNSSKDFMRVQDTDTIRCKLADGSNINFEFAEETFSTDTWCNIEILRESNVISCAMNGTGAEATAEDGATVTFNRICALTDGHISDFLFKKGSLPTAAERIKFRNWLDMKNDLTWMEGGLTT